MPKRANLSFWPPFSHRPSPQVRLLHGSVFPFGSHLCLLSVPVPVPPHKAVPRGPTLWRQPHGWRTPDNAPEPRAGMLGESGKCVPSFLVPLRNVCDPTGTAFHRRQAGFMFAMNILQTACISAQFPPHLRGRIHPVSQVVVLGELRHSHLSVSDRMSVGVQHCILPQHTSDNRDFTQEHGPGQS